jgi:hypothetical protein
VSGIRRFGRRLLLNGGCNMLAMEDNTSVVTTGIQIAWFGFVAVEVGAAVVIIKVGEERVEG